MIGTDLRIAMSSSNVHLCTFIVVGGNGRLTLASSTSSSENDPFAVAGTGASFPISSMKTPLDL